MSATLCENVNGNLVPVGGQFIEPNSYSFTPVGTIISVMGTSAPEGYLVCDGQSLLIADYSELAAYFLEQFGSVNHFGGNGITTFAVPDLRGEFLRGTGTNSHTDQGSGDLVGVHQDGTEHVINNARNTTNNKSLFYLELLDMTDNTVGANPKNVDTYILSTDGRKYLESSEYVRHSTSVNNSCSFTARPTNTSVLYCIAVKNLYYTNTPAEPNDSFILRNKILAFTNNVATVSASNVTSDTYFFVFYHDSCRETAQAADITVSSGAGLFTFTAKNTPEGQIVVDIMCTNFDQISGGGASVIDYSTDEQALDAKWVNGETIYQKSYVTDSTKSLSSSRVTRIFTPPSDMDVCVDMECSYTCMSLVYNNINDIGEWAQPGDYGVVIPAGTVITIRYTKVST